MKTGNPAAAQVVMGVKYYERGRWAGLQPMTEEPLTQPGEPGTEEDLIVYGRSL